MTKAIRFDKPGSSDVLQYVDVDLPPPGKGQVRIRHTAIGVNFIDTYHRTGLYPLPMPSGLGSEAAGVIEALGEGVSERVTVGEGVAEWLGEREIVFIVCVTAVPVTKLFKVRRVVWTALVCVYYCSTYYKAVRVCVGG